MQMKSLLVENAKEKLRIDLEVVSQWFYVNYYITPSITCISISCTKFHIAPCYVCFKALTVV